MKDRVIKTFSSNAALVAYAAEIMAPQIVAAAAIIRDSIDRGGKILICGNGGSAAHAQHLAAELIGRFSCERDGFPAIALTADSAVYSAISNDYGHDNVFARQVTALCRPDDVLVAITTSGRSGNVWRAARAAQRCGARVVGLTRTGMTRLDEQLVTLPNRDVMIKVPNDNTARIQELHQLAIHCLCDLVETA